MDQGTRKETERLILELLLEDVNSNIHRLGEQPLPKDTTHPTYRLEELEPDRRVALHIWKSEIERQRVTLRYSQMAKALSPGREVKETQFPKGTKTFSKHTSTAIQKLVRFFKNLMRSIKALIPAHFSLPQVCSSCREVHSEIFKTQCSHFYCKNCLIRMVTKSLVDESLFPLQCCHKKIEGSEMKKMIGSALAQEQRKRQTELSDPDRTYCSDCTCSRYISPANKSWPDLIFKPALTCQCGVRTCRVCKKSAHEGKCLPQLDWLMEKLMNKKSWKRCTKCSRVIELKEGCPHIIAQWCYHCGKKWKTCDCPK